MKFKMNHKSGNSSKKDKEGLFRSIFTAYFILLLHVFLLAGVGVTIVLFKGVYHYLPWIMGGLGILVLSFAWIFYRRIRSNTSDMKDILGMPEFQDRTVEVKFLGGLASFKVKANQNLPVSIGDHSLPHPNQLLIENQINKTEQKLIKLNALYEKDLITKEEFDRAKNNIIQG